MNATIAQLLAAVVPAITAALLQIGTSITQEPYALELIRIAGVNQREKCNKMVLLHSFILLSVLQTDRR